MMIIAAILPLKVSVTLSVILTLALLFLALGEKPLFWAVTVVGIAMLWRGEIWKAEFLESEVQLSGRQQPLIQRTLSNKESSRLLDESFRRDQNSLYDDAVIVFRLCGGQFQTIKWQFDPQWLVLSSQAYPTSDREYLQNSGETNLVFHQTSLEPFPALSLCKPRGTSLDQPQAAISAEEILNYHNQSEATPIAWCWCRLAF
jgi:hypothetical protein